MSGLCSFPKLSVTSPTSQLILQHFRHSTYVTAHSPTLPSLNLRHGSFSNLSVTSSTSQLILQTFRRFIHVTAHSSTFPSLHLRHNSFSNRSVALLKSHLILEPFRCFTYVKFIHQPFFRLSYVTSSSLTSSGKPPMGSLS